MLETTHSYGSMATAPRHLAAQAGLDVLRAGGNAIEARLVAASTISVLYPHMNGPCGDGFWLIGRHCGSFNGIRVRGRSAALASAHWPRDKGRATIPSRGTLAALGAAGWELAQRISRERLGCRLPLGRLLADAIRHARYGVALAATPSRNAAIKALVPVGPPGFADTHLPDGTPPVVGIRPTRERIAGTLERLAAAGRAVAARGNNKRSRAVRTCQDLPDVNQGARAPTSRER